MGSFVGLHHSVIRSRRTTSGERDLLGNEVWVDSEDRIAVAGWSTPTSDEPKVAGHDRLTVALELLAKPGDFLPDDTVTIEPYGQLLVVGWAENYSHGPFAFDPGLEVVNLGRDDR